MFIACPAICKLLHLLGVYRLTIINPHFCGSLTFNCKLYHFITKIPIYKRTGIFTLNYRKFVLYTKTLYFLFVFFYLYIIMCVASCILFCW